VTNDTIDQLKQELVESCNNVQWLQQQIVTVQEENSLLEQISNDQQNSLASLNNTLQSMTDENERLKQQHNEYQEKNETLTRDNLMLTHRLNTFEDAASSSSIEHQQTNRT
jgi:regulator of replication initiation timing